MVYTSNNYLNLCLKRFGINYMCTDRYVLLGNHRDSWTFGALDPSSGTASLVEIVRVFGKLKRDRSRDTLCF